MMHTKHTGSVYIVTVHCTHKYYYFDVLLTHTSDPNFFKTDSLASGPIVIFSPLDVKSISFSVGLSLAYRRNIQHIIRYIYIIL